MKDISKISEAYQFAIDNSTIALKTFLEDVRAMREVQDEYDGLLENLERGYGKEYLMFADNDEIDRLDSLFVRKHAYQKRVDSFLNKK